MDEMILRSIANASFGLHQLREGISQYAQTLTASVLWLNSSSLGPFSMPQIIRPPLREERKLLEEVLHGDTFRGTSVGHPTPDPSHSWLGNLPISEPILIWTSSYHATF
jgi:hypothetical protein